MERTIKRGDIFYADLNPVVGSEQGGRRPVLIISNDIGKEEVLGEWVFGCQGTVPVFATQRKMGRRLFCLTPHSPWETSIFPST